MNIFWNAVRFPSLCQVLSTLKEVVELGNLDAKRDWGYAKDYVNAMWLMLQQNEPRDLVISSGETHTVREFVTKAFAHAGINIE